MEPPTSPASPPKHSAGTLIAGAGLVLLGLALAAGGIYVGETDDAPGAAVLGLLLMGGAIVLGVKVARGRRK